MYIMLNLIHRSLPVLVSHHPTFLLTLMLGVIGVKGAKS